VRGGPAGTRGYWLVFAANTVSSLGDGVSKVALPWLATLLTRDALLISVVTLAGRLPWFLFALPAGVWTDRLDRRRLMVSADLVRLVLTAGIVGLILFQTGGSGGVAPILALSALTFLLGSAEVLHSNAAQTILPAIVAAADLERANGRLWSAEQVMNQFIGPPVAGALIGIGIAVPFGFDAATFGIAAALVAGLTVPAGARPPRRAFSAEMREGFAWLAGHRLIFQLAILLGLTNAAFTAAMVVLALYAQELLHLGAFAYGLLLTVAAAGGVAAGLAGPAIAARFGARPTVLISLAAFAAAYLALGLWPRVQVAAPALFIEAFAGTLWNVVTVSYRQRIIPGEILGRVNSIYRFFGWGTMPAGALAGGLLVKYSEPLIGRGAALALPFLVAGLITLALTVWAAARLRFPE